MSGPPRDPWGSLYSMSSPNACGQAWQRGARTRATLTSNHVSASPCPMPAADPALPRPTPGIRAQRITVVRTCDAANAQRHAATLRQRAVAEGASDWRPPSQRTAKLALPICDPSALDADRRLEGHLAPLSRKPVWRRCCRRVVSASTARATPHHLRGASLTLACAALGSLLAHALGGGGASSPSTRQMGSSTSTASCESMSDRVSGASKEVK